MIKLTPLAVVLLLGACSDGKSKGKSDDLAVGGSDLQASKDGGGDGDLASSDLAGGGGDLISAGYTGPPFEAFFYAAARYESNNTTLREESDGMFWQPASANVATADAYFPEIAALTSVAVGDCGTDPGTPSYSSQAMSAGTKIYWRDGATNLLTLTGGPPSSNNYFGENLSASGGLLGVPLDFAVDPGGTIPGFTVPDVGQLPGLIVPGDTSCAAGASCQIATTLSGTVDDYYFTTIGLRVCRANASTGEVTLPKTLIDAIGAVPTQIHLYALRKVQVTVGTSPMMFYLLISKTVKITVN